MAVFNWSALSSGAINFNPSVDRLHFDSTGISAAAVSTTSSSGTVDTVFQFGNKVVTLRTASGTITTGNITFADGSRLVIGDNLVTEAGDDGNNTLQGSAFNDLLIGAGGTDMNIGGDGNDVFQIAHDYGPTFAYGNDTLDGGNGHDRMFYNVTNGWGVDINFATGLATGGDGLGSQLRLISIEEASGTAQSDRFTGDADNEIFTGFGSINPNGTVGSDEIDGGAGTDTAVYRGTRSQYTITNNANGTVTVTDTRGSTAAFDGIDILRNVERLQFSDVLHTLTPSGPNNPPVITVPNANVSVRSGQSVTASSFFTASDPESNAITHYRFHNDAGGGHFRLGGTAQPEGQAFSVTAAQLGSLTFLGGGNGSERVFISASDNGGATYGEWGMLNVTSANRLPVVAVTTSQASVQNGESVTASSFFTASDPDGNAITNYRFYNDAGGGRFTLGSAAQPEGANFSVTAAQLGSLRFAGGGNGTERVFIAASDDGGASYGEWAMLNVTAQNRLPVVAVSTSEASVKAGQSVTASSFFTASDPDGDTLTHYRFYNDAGGGRFTLGGTAQAEGANFSVTAAQLGSLRFAGGGTGTERVFIAASDDGGANYGEWAMLNVTAQNRLPVVTAPNAEVTVRNGQSVTASSLISASDPNGDPITSYRFHNDSGGGRFELSGTPQPQGQAFDVAAGQLGNLRFVGAGTGTERIFAAASDGAGFGAWTQLTVTNTA